MFNVLLVNRSKEPRIIRHLLNNLYEQNNYVERKKKKTRRDHISKTRTEKKEELESGEGGVLLEIKKYNSRN